MNSDLPIYEKAPARVQRDATTSVGADSETTVRTLEVITFYLLTKLCMKERLEQELVSVPKAENLDCYDVPKRQP